MERREWPEINESKLLFACMCLGLVVFGSSIIIGEAIKSNATTLGKQLDRIEAKLDKLLQEEVNNEH